MHDLNMGFNEKVRQIWRDPVLSKVISIIMIALFGFLYALISKFNINSLFSWSFGFVISLILFVFFRYILKKIILYKNDPSFPLISENVLREIHTEKDEDHEEKNDIEKNINNTPIESKYNWYNSDILFAKCIAQTFPGDRNIVWYTSSDSVQKLNLFFENVRKQEPIGDAVWWRRGYQAFPVKSAEILDVDKILLETERFKISRMAVLVSQSYYKHFIYIEAAGEPTTGLYPEITDTYIKKTETQLDYVTEEYGEFNGKIISRQEYDDGASVHKNNVVQHNGQAKLRVRYLTKVNFVLTPKNSPYNSRKFEKESIIIFNNILHLEENPCKLFEFMDNFQKTDMPNSRHE